jgi:hypothetical protein
MLMALLSVSWYVPDETWQSVEISHGVVWPGKSFKTWEWDHGLRSYLHPLLFVPGFEILKFFQMDSPFIVSTLPRLLQGLLTSVADVTFVGFFDRHFAKRRVDTKWFVFIYLTNWCQSYKTFFFLSLMMRPKKLERLSLETLSSQVLEFEVKAGANPIGARFRCFLLGEAPGVSTK